MTYDHWKTTEPDPHEFDERPTEEDEIRSQIDGLMQTASTAEQWMEICQGAIAIGDEPPIKVANSLFGNEFAAHRADWDLGMPTGYGKTELEAIADLLDQETA